MSNECVAVVDTAPTPAPSRRAVADTWGGECDEGVELIAEELDHAVGDVEESSGVLPL